jgi:hypothetical protein
LYQSLAGRAGVPARSVYLRPAFKKSSTAEVKLRCAADSMGGLGTRDRKSAPELQSFAGKTGLFPAMTHSDCTPSLGEGLAHRVC